PEPFFYLAGGQTDFPFLPGDIRVFPAEKRRQKRLHPCRKAKIPRKNPAFSRLALRDCMCLFPKKTGLGNPFLGAFGCRCSSVFMLWAAEPLSGLIPKTKKARNLFII
ncbi:hypothetical protein, partial [Anaerotignum sp.]|uniref:hypothetical protein n=1 Tax=Anaerotignum sp. TaxID=2039241 RepID=UPI0039A15D94